MMKHIFDAEGDCEACGVNQYRCDPVKVKTVLKHGLNKAEGNQETGLAPSWAEELWQLLDDIDTASDMFKPLKTNFYQYVMRKVDERFRYYTSDGYKLTKVIQGVECAGNKHRVDDLLQTKEESSAKPETLSPQANVVSGESDFVLWRDLNHNEIVLNGDRYYNNEDKAFELFFGEEKWTSDNPRWQSPNSWQRSVLGSGTKSVAASTDSAVPKKESVSKFDPRLDPEEPMPTGVIIKAVKNSTPVPHDCLQEKEIGIPNWIWAQGILEDAVRFIRSSAHAFAQLPLHFKDGISENIVADYDGNRKEANRLALELPQRWNKLNWTAGVVHPDTERHQLEKAAWIRERNQLRAILEALPADNIIGTPNTEPASLEWFAEKFGYRCGFPALVEMLRKYAALRRQYTKPLIELYSKLGRIIPPRSAAMSDTGKEAVL